MTQLMTLQEVAELTGLSYHAVWRAVQAGELRATKLRGRIRIRPEWLDEWADMNVIRPVPPVVERAEPRRRRAVAASHGPGSVARLRAIEGAG